MHDESEVKMDLCVPGFGGEKIVSTTLSKLLQNSGYNDSSVDMVIRKRLWAIENKYNYVLLSLFHRNTSASQVNVSIKNDLLKYLFFENFKNSPSILTPKMHSEIAFLSPQCSFSSLNSHQKEKKEVTLYKS